MGNWFSQDAPTITRKEEHVKAQDQKLNHIKQLCEEQNNNLALSTIAPLFARKTYQTTFDTFATMKLSTYNMIVQEQIKTAGSLTLLGALEPQYRVQVNAQHGFVFDQIQLVMYCVCGLPVCIVTLMQREQTDRIVTVFGREAYMELRASPPLVLGSFDSKSKYESIAHVDALIVKCRGNLVGKYVKQLTVPHDRVTVTTPIEFTSKNISPTLLVQCKPKYEADMLGQYMTIQATMYKDMEEYVQKYEGYTAILRKCDQNDCTMTNMYTHEIAQVLQAHCQHECLKYTKGKLSNRIYRQSGYPYSWETSTFSASSDSLFTLKNSSSVSIRSSFNW